MYFSTIAAAILPLVAMTVAAPAPFTKRTPGSVTLCTGPDHTGDCLTRTFDDWEQCHTLTGDLAPFYHNLGTFAPDAGALCRVTNTAESCTTHGDLFVENPEGANLLDVNGVDYGSTATSFLCQRCNSCTGGGFSNSTVARL
ncbi:uncharacterized protein K452DRAFT_285447 [Aplosporella prunicola CBS 121167]|uniref:Cyanovirin-N domain-containing protein n=1 Tax=Aplosporella prunicola CBS 121167 TaxID=1176127 RepID=A0A6A6BLM2_9PEZI|nr:uncharacterized protein K452DRAFT_285447 [Aplosporella prunicola CBS 121167]KAF2144205.1 hypothetical protein K452DRAFT_285447 [Aplosporella prunicola CBS 121167]